MLDPKIRLAAHLSAPDIYDAPSHADLHEILREIKQSREFAEMLYLSIKGGGMTVTFNAQDLQVIRALAEKG